MTASARDERKVWLQRIEGSQQAHANGHDQADDCTAETAAGTGTSTPN
jgi:hypothetical protein